MQSDAEKAQELWDLKVRPRWEEDGVRWRLIRVSRTEHMKGFWARTADNDRIEIITNHEALCLLKEAAERELTAKECSVEFDASFCTVFDNSGRESRCIAEEDSEHAALIAALKEVRGT